MRLRLIMLTLATGVATCSSPADVVEDEFVEAPEVRPDSLIRVQERPVYSGEIRGDEVFHVDWYVSGSQRDRLTLDIGAWGEDPNTEILIDGEWYPSMICGGLSAGIPGPGGPAPDYPRDAATGRRVGVPDADSPCGAWMIEQHHNAETHRIGSGWLHDISVSDDRRGISFEAHNFGNGTGPHITYGEWRFSGQVVPQGETGSMLIEGTWALEMSRSRREKLAEELEEGSISQAEYDEALAAVPNSSGTFAVGS